MGGEMTEEELRRERGWFAKKAAENARWMEEAFEMAGREILAQYERERAEKMARKTGVDVPIMIVSLNGGRMTLALLQQILEILNRDGRVSVIDVAPGSVDLLELGAQLYELGRPKS